MTSGAGPDVVEAPGGRGRPVRALWVAVAAVSVVAALLWVEGVRRQPAERAGLDRCAGQATTAVAGAEIRLAAISSYIAPALGVGTGELDTGLRRLVAEQARRARGPVDAARRTCREVSVWVFNADHRAARAAYVDLLEAQRRHLRAVVRDGRPFGPRYDQVVRLRREAERRWPWTAAD